MESSQRSWRHLPSLVGKELKQCNIQFQPITKSMYFQHFSAVVWVIGLHVHDTITCYFQKRMIYRVKTVVEFRQSAKNHLNFQNFSTIIWVIGLQVWSKTMFGLFATRTICRVKTVCRELVTVVVLSKDPTHVWFVSLSPLVPLGHGTP